MANRIHKLRVSDPRSMHHEIGPKKTRATRSRCQIRQIQSFKKNQKQRPYSRRKYFCSACASDGKKNFVSLRRTLRSNNKDAAGGCLARFLLPAPAQFAWTQATLTRPCRGQDQQRISRPQKNPSQQTQIHFPPAASRLLLTARAGRVPHKTLAG